MDTDDAEVSDGVLNRDETARRLQTTRLQPDPTLSGIVSHYWILRWNIPAGERHTVSTLGRLGCSFVWTESEALLYGVQSARFSYELTGVGRILGAKLTPAGIRAFCETPAQRLGYYDQAHLTTAFRAAVGTAPHSYRRGLEEVRSSTRR